jgi:hypothetical protein
MPESILGASWYKATDIARVLEIPIEQAEAMLKRAVESGKHAIAYHTSPSEPAINGYTLMQLVGQRQPPTHMPTTRRRRR